MAKRRGGAMVQNVAPTRSQLIPILSKWGELGSKSQLVPMIVTIVTVFLMYLYAGDTEPLVYRIGDDPTNWIYTSRFIIVLALYLTLLSLYFIYRLVGKKKSWTGI